PFRVEVTDTPPADGPYTMVMVGGNATIIGQPSGVAGLAPLDCGDQNDSDIAFAFTDLFATDDVHNLAVTIAQESAHSFGLGHTGDPTDLMYPAVSGREAAFQDHQMKIYDLGSTSTSCDGTGVQNSYQLMMINEGGSAPDLVPPDVGFVAPVADASVPSTFTIALAASDDVALARVELWAAAARLGTLTHAPWTFA